MANKNQGVRSGNAFGRLANVDYSSYDTDKVALKPGYLVRMRDRFHLVEAMEPLAVDLWFTDTVNFGVTTVESGVDTGASTIRYAHTPTGTHGNALAKYGLESMSAYFGFGEDNAAGAVSASDLYGNILKPNFDSGYLQFKDIEPFKGNLYQLCPTLPNQPKYMDETGNWHSRTVFGPGDYSATDGAGFEPIGFPSPKLLTAVNSAALDAYEVGDTLGTGSDDAAAGVVTPTQIGTVSAKLYIKHPAGVPRGVLDEAPEGESGPTAHSSSASGSIEGLSGFIDGQMSPLESPNWAQSIFIEHGENNMPIFRLVNDSDEFLMDGRIRLVGWKYRVIELTKEQLQLFKQRSGGRLTFKIINTTGLPVSGAMLADYFPK